MNAATDIHESEQLLSSGKRPILQHRTGLLWNIIGFNSIIIAFLVGIVIGRTSSIGDIKFESNTTSMVVPLMKKPPIILDLHLKPYLVDGEGLVTLNDTLSTPAAEYGFHTCLGNEYGYQMEHAWCWDRRIFIRKSFPYPMDPRKALAHQTYLFTGDSMSRLAFRGFVCVIEGCKKPNATYMSSQRHGQIEIYNKKYNITAKFEWAPMFDQLITNLTKKATIHDNVFISIGVHFFGHPQLGETIQDFSQKLEHLIDSRKLKNVFLQTPPRPDRNRHMTVGAEYINGLLFKSFYAMYPKILLLDGSWPNPVYDMKDGLHSFAMAHATGVRFAWTKVWAAYGQKHNLKLKNALT